jgi:hypothetical protein
VHFLLHPTNEQSTNNQTNKHKTKPKQKRMFQVVNCFLGIIIFQLVCEQALEELEELARGTVGL